MTADDRLLFEACGLRCTRQRRLVFDTLRSTTSHPTADELYQLCIRHMPGLSLATVYNALEKLVDAGLVRKLPGAGANGSARYDAATDDHPHARCTRTGRVADLPDDAAEKLLRNIPKRVIRELEEHLGFKVDRVQIELLGEFLNENNSDESNEADESQVESHRLADDDEQQTRAA